MSHVALTVIAPLQDGRRNEVAAAVDALPTGAASPLARIPGMHMGRLTVVDRLDDPRGPTAPVLGPYLLVTVDADGPQEAVVAALAAGCGTLFAACVGCPDVDDGAAFRTWLLRHRVKDRFTIMPYAERSLPEVQAALALRARLGTFAVQAAGPPGPGAPSLRAHFLQVFGRGRVVDTERADG